MEHEVENERGTQRNGTRTVVPNRAGSLHDTRFCLREFELGFAESRGYNAELPNTRSTTQVGLPTE